MKKVIVIFVVIFVAGILAGGAYEGLSNGGIKAIWPFKTDAKAVQAQPQPEPQPESEPAPQPGPPPESAADQALEKTGSDKKEHLVTNPDKICATPGCDNAVFVTYKDRELCVKCYGEAKNRDTKNQ